ncbi:MAG: type II secretion system protein [Phycisphaeraceae bacterium]|nr:type II secretion system protein [Phycisphaeraceae bacterium]
MRLFTVHVSGAGSADGSPLPMPCPRRALHRRGFTLVELIIAILVLGMGLVMLAAIFPAGIAQQQFSNDDVFGRVVADHAIAVIRSKVRQEDFGTFEQFYLRDARSTGDGGSLELPYRSAGSSAGSAPNLFGLAGDWGWKRPGFVFDNPNTPFNEARIDIFSWDATYRGLGAASFFPQQPTSPDFPLLSVNTALDMATEFPAGRNAASEPASLAPLPIPAAIQNFTHTLYGIPYNRSRFDSDLNVRSVEAEVVGYDTNGAAIRRPKVPAFYISQAERTWPQGSGTRANPGQYYWDCMFRRFEGRIYVAIFVYRVAAPGGEPRTYSVARAPNNPANLGQPQSNADLPPLPVTIRLGNTSNQGVGAIGANPGPLWTVANRDIVPNTNPGTTWTPYNAVAQSGAWQLPGQWILDKFNNVHRVVGGRRVPTNGPVRLARPIPAVPPVPALVGRASGPDPDDQGSTSIDQIWYLPGRDAAGNTIIPVFCTVQEL